jgi:hypothetical protein
MITRFTPPRVENRTTLDDAQRIDRTVSVATAAFACSVAVILAFATAIPAALGQTPGTESFAKTPKTPFELWDAIDYLVRVGHPDQAVPYINTFIKANPDDSTLAAIQDKYGIGSILRLDDHPVTQELGKKLATIFDAAARREAVRPARIEKFVAALTGSNEERAYAVQQLRDARQYAVPYLAKALDKNSYTVQERGKIARAMGELDRSAVPALIGLLQSPKPNLAAAAADALASIGDLRAIPSLTINAALPGIEPTAQAAARRAITKLTGKTYDAQPKSPVRLLIDEAWSYHRHERKFPGPKVEVWIDDPDSGLIPEVLSVGDAEAVLGLDFARGAIEIDPSNREAHVVFVSLAIEKAIDRVGAPNFPTKDPTGVYPIALAAGADVMGDVLRAAIADDHMELAAASATILGQIADSSAMSSGARPFPLMEALKAPDRRVQFAAARALVMLDPRKPFPGSSHVVPMLARFLGNQPLPRAIIIDSSNRRGNFIASHLIKLGFDVATAETGPAGFELAARSADVEVVFIEPDLFQGDWTLADTLANLRGDARTAGLPILLYGPQNYEVRMKYYLENDKRLRFIILPVDEKAMKSQLDNRLASMRVKPISAAERDMYAQTAAALLGRIANAPGSPFENDLAGVEAQITTALVSAPPGVAIPATVALEDIPDSKAQQSLAEIVLNPSRPLPLRVTAAVQLAQSIQRFGPVISATQEEALAAQLNDARSRDPNLHAALAVIVGAMRPKPAFVGKLLVDSDPLAQAPNQQPQGQNGAPQAKPPAAPDANAPANEQEQPPAGAAAAKPGGIPAPDQN